MNNAIIIDRNGNTIDDDSIVPDGGSVRVAMPFMDSAASAAIARVFGDAGNSRVLHDGTGGPAGFRPGYAFGGLTPFAHHQRTAHARAGYIDDLSNAWRNPPIVQPEPLPPKRPQRDSNDPNAAYRNYVNTISSAWKTAT